MHPEDIKAAIRKKGYTLGQLAKVYGLRENAIREVLAGRRNAKAMKVVASFLKVSLGDLLANHKYDFTTKSPSSHRAKNTTSAGAGR